MQLNNEGEVSGTEKFLEKFRSTGQVTQLRGSEETGTPIGRQSMATPNRFAGRCNNRACPLKKNIPDGVAVGEGYITKINDRWATWCRQCVPVQVQPQEAERRVLTADGKIIVPYDANALPLIKSLRGPGGKFGPKWHDQGKFWEVSLEQADRQRLLEVAQRLKLEIAPQLLAGNIITEQAQNATNAGLYPFQVTGVNWMSKRLHYAN